MHPTIPQRPPQQTTDIVYANGDLIRYRVVMNRDGSRLLLDPQIRNPRPSQATAPSSSPQPGSAFSATRAERTRRQR